MLRKLFGTLTVAFAVVGFAVADEVDAVVDDANRAFTKMTKSPEKINYGQIWLDSKGKLVIQVNKEGKVTKDTTVAMGTFDEKKKKWVPGEAIEGGIGADLFKNKGKVLRLHVTLADDDTTIKQILVTSTDGKYQQASSQFIAVYKRHGAFTNGRGPISFVRLEVDENGRVINTFPLQTAMVLKETKIAMGKVNEKDNTFEAGDDVPERMYGDVFKDAGAKNVYVRMSYRPDGLGIAQILVIPDGKK